MKRNILALTLAATAVSAVLAIPDRVTVRLHVTDAATHKDIPSAAITLDKNFLGLTNSDGGFLVTNQTPHSTHYLDIYKKGYAVYKNPSFTIDPKPSSISITLTAQ